MGNLVTLNKRKPFEIINKSKTEADIVIYSDIGAGYWGDSMSAKDFDASLREIPNTVTQLNVRLNSPGGDVFDGITIYNRLKRHKAKVTVYVDGLAASIASVIMLAGDEVVFGEGALAMIHKPYTMSMGNSTELEQTIQLLDEIEDQIINIYMKKTNKDRTELRNLMAQETWFNAQEALEIGFADSIMAEEEVLDIAASLDRAKWIKNKPKIENRKTKIVKEQIGSLTKNIEDFLAR